MGVAVAALHVLLADVLGAPVPVIVGVVALARDEPAEQGGEVLEEAVLELVDPHAAGRVGRVDARDPVPDAALANSVGDLSRNVPNGQPALCSQLPFLLERLHRRPSYPRVAREYAGARGGERRHAPTDPGRRRRRRRAARRPGSCGLRRGRPDRVHRRLVARVVGNGRARACDRRVDCSQRR